MSLKPRTIWKFFAHIMHAHFPLIKIDRLIFCNSLIFLALKSFLFSFFGVDVHGIVVEGRPKKLRFCVGLKFPSLSLIIGNIELRNVCVITSLKVVKAKKFSRLFCQLDTEKGTCCRMTAMEVYEAS